MLIPAGKVGQNPQSQATQTGQWVAQTWWTHLRPEYTGIHDSLIRVMFVFLPGTEMLTINNFLFKAQIDNINLFKVDDSVTILI